MLKSLLIMAVLAIVALLGYAATRPDSFNVQRSIAIQAAPEQIYPLISDFRRWADWSPYEKLDPAMHKQFSGAQSGLGAIYAWDGNSDAGAGRLQIVEAQAPNLLGLDIAFERPMQDKSRIDFTLLPEGGATRVSWAMHGTSPYLCKLMGVFFDMDHMIGKDFEAGLAALKAQVESAAAPTP